LLTNEMDSKRRLEEANRIIREQSHQGFQPASASGSVGPSLPVPQSKRPMDHPTESAAKRIRPSLSTTNGAPPHPPPPPPPPGFEGVVPASFSSPRMANPLAGDASLGYGGRATTAAMGMQPNAGSMPTTPATPTAPADPLPDGSILTDSTSKVVPEDEFAASLNKPEVTLQIRIPNDPSQMAWNFYGQVLSIPVNVMAKVKVVKEELAQLHLNGMPANKIQLKEPNKGFLKDAMTLAAHNVGPTATLELTLKTRGGRK
jgi:hypothetical protein